MLLEGLNTRLMKWSSKQCIGDIFLFMVSSFSLQPGSPTIPFTCTNYYLLIRKKNRENF